MPYLDIKRERENGVLLEEFISEKGTRVEMIRCPALGVACFMDGLIQSCELDEHVYHSALVAKTLERSSSTKNVLILGGGEGAVAREVLRYNTVENVEMIDWDEEVVRMFRERYSQWGNRAWEDERLHVIHEDVIEKQDYPDQMYDIIFIDLFDVSSDTVYQYKKLLGKLSKAIKSSGIMIMYCGMDTSEDCNEWIKECMNSSEVMSKDQYSCELSSCYVPSFEGHAMFLSWFPRSG